MKNTGSSDSHVHILPPPVLFLGTLIFGLLLGRAVPLAKFPRNTSRIAGALLALLGVFFSGWAIKTMRKAGTSPNPRDPVKTIVQTGPYQYTRNPIYLSFFMLYSGISLLANSIWPILIAPALFLILNTQVVRHEENYLSERFGQTYLDYKARVHRWI